MFTCSDHHATTRSCILISDRDPCSSGPCQNDGKCYGGEDGYICNCGEMHKGFNCETCKYRVIVNEMITLKGVTLWFGDLPSYLVECCHSGSFHCS